MLALVEALKSQVPFSLLDDKAFKAIETSSQIAYYPEDSVLIAENTIPQNIFLIIKGTVEAMNGEDLIDIYNANDVFGAIEVIRNQPTKDSYTVRKELICYEVPLDTFLKITQENNAFKTYFLSTIIERIDMMKEKKENLKAAEIMVERVEDHLLHTACIVDADTPVLEALSKMEREKAVALIVRNAYGYGIVTDADLRYYILHKEEDALLLISQIQSYPLISIREDELLFNVLLTMTGRNIKHLPVFDEEKTLVGILVLTDLLSYLSNQSHLISVQMERAETIEDVIAASSRIDVMISLLHSKGVKSRYIAKMVSEMHKKMYAKLFKLIFPNEWHHRCTLILLGSEGRGEQILKTDQDNGLIFEDGFEPENKEEITLKFTETLDTIGFPRCKGNVMVINPKWAKSTSSYKSDILRWITSPQNGDLLDAAIFYDTFAVAGNVSLFKDLRDHFMKQMKQHKAFLPHFARAIESFESPLGLFSRFVSDDKGHKNEIDIKKGALFALIHGVRVLAMEHGIHKTNTTERIKALNNIGYLNKEDAGDLLETLEVINTFRLHAQLDKLQNDKEIDNYICLTTLGKLERDTLKEALKTVEQFKKRVSYHYHLSMVS